MGDTVDMILDGMLCTRCGTYIDAGCGHPTKCERCALKEQREIWRENDRYKRETG